MLARDVEAWFQALRVVNNAGRDEQKAPGEQRMVPTLVSKLGWYALLRHSVPAMWFCDCWY